MSAFDRLSPAMQYQIVNGLGFRELRPVQEQAIGPVLDGHNCVVLAPTAGGKTEAALFPMLSRMDSEDWRPVSLLYVAPIRALLNDQEARLARYAALIGRRAAKWHGDTTPSERKAFLADPADVLLTTPESLEVMLMSPRIPAARLFRGLRAIVVDEVHAFVGDDRGSHLSAVLERLSRICGNDVQRIGLSATVGNPEEILAWLAGGSKRPGSVVRAPGARAAPELVLDYVATHENAARMIAELHPGKKRLVFVDSRRGVETIGKLLRERGVSAFVTHSSLALSERRAAEAAFAEGKDCVIVATSALELGIDIGDLDHVLQIGCPSTVASFLQRLGRSGRRPGTRANYTFLALDEEQLVQAAALLRLHASGFVEPVRVPRQAAHVLAHQILALSIQEHGIPESDWWAWVARASGFAGLSEEDRRALVEHMLEDEILVRDGGRLSLGPRGEKLYGFRNFLELYSVFSTPKALTVLFGTQEIGTIEAQFAEQEEPGRLTFTLAARTWRAQSIDFAHGVLHVEPAEQAAHARWQGKPHLLGQQLCQAIREVLTSGTEDPWWSRRALEKLREAREEHSFVNAEGTTLTSEPGGLRLWTFAGGKANNLLAAALEKELGERVTSNNLALLLKDQAGQSEVAVHQALVRIKEQERPDSTDALAYVGRLSHARLSKFQPCLPATLEERLLADQLTDAAGARMAIR
jgi:ATP-dependent Lhr-like helicase